jgi:hypothetical protein
MTTEYRVMTLGGGLQGRWNYLTPEVAERLLSQGNGVGSLGDQRADPGSYWEFRTDGGPWRTFSYWAGATEFWIRSRLLEVERLNGDERVLRRQAQGLRDGAGATIQGIRNQIAAAEEALKVALEQEKRDKAEARDLEGKADAVAALIPPVQREVDRGVPEPVTA